jgi:hypothetical protein
VKSRNPIIRDNEEALEGKEFRLGLGISAFLFYLSEMAGGLPIFHESDSINI